MPNIRNDITDLLSHGKIIEAIDLLDNAITGHLENFRLKIVTLRSDNHELELKRGIAITEENYNVQKVDLKRRILDLLRLIEETEINSENLSPLIKSTLLREDSYPFLDRLDFRNNLKEILLSNKSGFLFVEGRSKSGLSYIGNYLVQLQTNFELFNAIDIKVDNDLNVPEMNLGEKLASLILEEFGCETSAIENAQFKFVKFINVLKSKVKGQQKIPIFFLHDFHKIDESNKNLLDFLFRLLTEINENFPKCIFIFTGLNYRNIQNWQYDLRFLPTVKTYQMETIKPEHIKPCLEDIFEKYESAIHKFYKEKSKDEMYEEMQKEEYVNGLMSQYKDLPLSKLSFEIKDQLYELKKILS